MDILDLEKEIKIIKERNLRVEGDKAWETSNFRIITIAIIIYILASLLLYFVVGVSNALLNALIPAVGYFLSVQSLPFIKRWWIKKHFKK